MRACDVNNGGYRKPVTHRCHLSVPWTMLGPTEADRPHSDHPTVDSLSAVPHCDDATTRGPYVKLLAYEMAVRRSGGPHMPAVAGLSGSRRVAGWPGRPGPYLPACLHHCMWPWRKLKPNTDEIALQSYDGMHGYFFYRKIELPRACSAGIQHVYSS